MLFKSRENRSIPEATSHTRTVASPNVGLGPKLIAAACGEPPTQARPAYTPSTGNNAPAGAGAQIDLVGMQADEARHLEARLLGRRGGRPRGGHQQHESARDADDGLGVLAQGVAAAIVVPQVGQSGSLAMRMR